MKQFEVFRINKPKKSSFDLSHENKTSISFGDLLPTMKLNCMPGDHFSINLNHLTKLQALRAPIMQRCDIFHHFFFVPFRILDKNFERELAGGYNGARSSDTNCLPVARYFEYFDNAIKLPGMDEQEPLQYELFYDEFVGVNSLFDHMNCAGMLWKFYQQQKALNVSYREFVDKFKVTGTIYNLRFDYFSLLPFMAYNQIFGDYYWNQNFMDFTFGGTNPTLSRLYRATQPYIYSDGNELADYGFRGLDIEFGANNIADFRMCQCGLFSMKKRAWEKDYFTSSLPWTQRGDAVTIPLLDEFWMRVNLKDIDRDHTGVQDFRVNSVEGIARSAIPFFTPFSGSQEQNIPPDTGQAAGTDRYTFSFMKAGTYNVPAISMSIDTLRTSLVMQQFLEKNARGGVRYVEFLLHHFGIKPQDSRLDRAEYIYGCKSPLQVGEIIQTSETTVDNSLGTMSGSLYSLDSSRGFTYDVKEHGMLMCISSIMPRSGYLIGRDKIHDIRDVYDFPFPDFAGLGEQEVSTSEVYYTGVPSKSDERQVFGYQERYADWRTKLSEIHGDMKDDLAHWHMSRIFDAPPVLNNDFVTYFDDITRIFNGDDPEYTKFVMQLYFKVFVNRCLPKHGTPGLRRV
ncbi:major capsid protein [Tortoise microvirus 31]|nr:major capsid protein [Tortoise microvirus 31]